ncbi:MAG: hypothetical protein A2051_03110 [Desulfovibrionales bacterium GWA2_65_9]|nr:MAG: hypothetical protein A2051_03110 [Desulfovibrionales bacterium GWA2_65_9]
MPRSPRPAAPPPWLGRRQFLRQLLAAGAALTAAPLLRPLELWAAPTPAAPQVFVARAASYAVDLRQPMLDALNVLGLAGHLRGKKVVLKPNLVEPHAGAEHINTHPEVVRAAAQAFLSLGAASVTVAEGAGHIRDPHEVLEASGLGDVLRQERLRFVDLNTAPFATLANPTRLSGLTSITLPRLLLEADLVVSLAKMKTHHWAGVTLSMKNLFGTLPGSVYGWPKNALHMAGIQACCVDITATLAPNLAIIDGVVGMEGDGPIMGAPVKAGLLVAGTNLPAVDATCCRLMGIDPERVEHLKMAARLGLGSIAEGRVAQLGETLAAARHPFQLRLDIPAQAALLAL